MEPPTLPFGPIRTARLLRRNPLTLIRAVAELGDVSYLRMPGLGVWVLNHPDLAWNVLVTRSGAFMKGPTMQAAKRMLGESLLTSEGDLHRRERRLIQPIFHHDRIDAYAGTMVELSERWADRRRADERIDLHVQMSGLALGIVGRTLFGHEVSAEGADAVGRAMRQTLEQFGRVFSPLLPVSERIPFLPSNRRFAAARRLFDDTVYDMITERRAAADPGDDLLGQLLRARDDGVGMSDEQVRDEAITLFLAGHETTAVALTWTWYLLSAHPEAERRLHAELDDVLAGRTPTIRDLPELRWTSAVISESMRLFPPAWAIGRRALEPHDAGPHRIPAGSVVVVSPFLLHHDPRWWPDPEAFRPERWLREDPDRPRHAYLPFGGGPRMCIGEGFASVETRLVLATIARRWRFAVDEGYRPDLQPVVTLRPRRGLPSTVRPRAD